MDECKTGLEKLEGLATCIGKARSCSMLNELAGRNNCDGVYCGECYELAKNGMMEIIEQVKSETFARPRFDDGTPLDFHDKIDVGNGELLDVQWVKYEGDAIAVGDARGAMTVMPRDVKLRRAYDVKGMRAKLEEDKKKGTYEYWDCANVSCYGCDLLNGETPAKHYGVYECGIAAGMDIIRRQREIDELERQTFDWDAFKRCEFVVNCRTEEAASDFCKAMHERGMAWYAGNSYLDDTNFNVYKENMCYSGKGTFGSRGFYLKEGKTVVEWKTGDSGK